MVPVLLIPTVLLPSLKSFCESGEIQDSYVNAREHFIKSIDKGLLKVMSKMGISTLRSYHGAQIFEAIGISKDVTDRYFSGTDSRIGGIGHDEIAREALIMHNAAYYPDTQDGTWTCNPGNLSLQEEWRTACLES